MRQVEKDRAIELRKEGHTYSEILSEVHIAKSTLSDWLKSVSLAVPQKQRLTEKRMLAARRGGVARRKQRMEQVAECNERGRADIGTLNQRELWLIGTALYWAEGSKQKENNVSAGIIFGNSDSRMIKTFLHWVKLVGISEENLRFELYVHETRKADVPSFQKWWAKVIDLPQSRIDRIYFKKGNIKTNRKNIGDLYHGLLRIKVNSSTKLNRLVNGWVEGIVASLGSGVTGNTSAFEAEDSRIVP